MSIFSKIARAVGRVFSGAEDGAEKATDEFGQFIGTASDQVVVALKQTDVGTAVVNMISAVDGEDLSGADKFDKVVSEAAPLVVDFITRGGFPALIDDVEDLTRQLTQSIYNDFKSTSFGKVLMPLLKLLGIGR